MTPARRRAFRSARHKGAEDLHRGGFAAPGILIPKGEGGQRLPETKTKGTLLACLSFWLNVSKTLFEKVLCCNGLRGSAVKILEMLGAPVSGIYLFYFRQIKPGRGTS